MWALCCWNTYILTRVACKAGGPLLCALEEGHALLQGGLGTTPLLEVHFQNHTREMHHATHPSFTVKTACCPFSLLLGTNLWGTILAHMPKFVSHYSLMFHITLLFSLGLFHA